VSAVATDEPTVSIQTRQICLARRQHDARCFRVWISGVAVGWALGRVSKVQGGPNCRGPEFHANFGDARRRTEGRGRKSGKGKGRKMKGRKEEGKRERSGV